MKEFKIRASGSSQIMAEPKLKKDKEAGLLGQTAKTYCENWLKEQIYQRRKEFSSKKTDKGTDVEDNSLDFLIENEILPFCMKNETFFEDDFFTGTPDVLLSDTVIDLKNSWDCFSFPLFEQEITNKAYIYQLQVYMHMTGLKKAKLIYILSNTPDEIVEKEIFFAINNKGLSQIQVEDIQKRITDYHNYDNIDLKNRVKIYEIDYDPKIIVKIKSQVIKCRNYIQTLIN